MKKLLAILLTVISASVMAEWTYVAESDSINVFIDIASKRKVGKKVTVWRLMDFKSPEKWNNKDYLSLIFKTEFDCVNETAKDINITAYSGNMQKGESLGSLNYSNTNEEIRPIAPNSLDSFVYKKACSKN